MELFEEALQKWEQALSVGQRGDGGSTPTPGDSFQNPDTSSEAPSEVGDLPQPLCREVGGVDRLTPDSGVTSPPGLYPLLSLQSMKAPPRITC